MLFHNVHSYTVNHSTHVSYIPMREPRIIGNSCGYPTIHPLNLLSRRLPWGFLIFPADLQVLSILWFLCALLCYDVAFSDTRFFEGCWRFILGCPVFLLCVHFCFVSVMDSPEGKTSMFHYLKCRPFIRFSNFWFLSLRPFVTVYELGMVIQELSKMSVRMVATFGERFSRPCPHHLGGWCLLQTPEDNLVSNVPRHVDSSS